MTTPTALAAIDFNVTTLTLVTLAATTTKMSEIFWKMSSRAIRYRPQRLAKLTHGQNSHNCSGCSIRGGRKGKVPKVDVPRTAQVRLGVMSEGNFGVKRKPSKHRLSPPSRADRIFVQVRLSEVISTVSILIYI